MKKLLIALFVFCATSLFAQSHDYLYDHYHSLDSVVSFETKAGLKKSFIIEFNKKYTLMGFNDRFGYIQSLLFCETSRTRPDIYGIDVMPIGKDLDRSIVNYTHNISNNSAYMFFSDGAKAIMKVFGDDSRISWEYGEINTTRYYIRYKF